MFAKSKKTKAAISTRVRNLESLSQSYWKNIKGRAKQKVLIGQVVRKNQDYPRGINLTTGIGEKRSSMHHIHILLLVRQYQCHGYLLMLIYIHIHHGTGMIHGHVIHLILDQLTKIVQLQEDHHLINNHMSKTVSIKKNRSGAQGRRKR